MGLPEPDSRTPSGEQGFALVLVVWGLAILSLVAVTLIAQARHEIALAKARVGEAQAELAADAAIDRAILSIDSRPDSQAWPEDGAPVAWTFDGATTRVAIADEDGKIDAVAAPDLMLKAALAYAGLDEVQQQQVMKEMRDARAALGANDSAARPASLDDLRAAMELSGAEIERLRTVLTVYSRQSGIDPQVASPDALRMLPGVSAGAAERYLADRRNTLARADSPDRPASPAPDFTIHSPRGMFTVRAEACAPGGYLAIREALVRRDAPGKFVRLEMRSPLTPRFQKPGCGKADAAASRDS